MTRTALFVQEACYSHRFIRTRDDSAIVERPERLRSVAFGLAAAIARLEEISPAAKTTATNAQLQVPSTAKPEAQVAGDSAADELTSALDKLTINSGPDKTPPVAFGDVRVVRSAARLSLLDDPAVKFIHGDIDGPGYIDKLITWAAASAGKVAQGLSEIPEGLHQGDLYLCPQTHDAVSGALGTVCEAVEAVILAAQAPKKLSPNGSQPVLEVPDVSVPAPSLASAKVEHLGSHAFVAIRPPGHHCGEDTPSGFCFVNNVMVGAAHAHLKHGLNRVVVFDIDLHHGNGTQAIAWSLNEEAYHAETEPDEGDKVKQEDSATADRKSKLKVFYGSLHDILSYPCEDGKAPLVQAASTSLHGAHGQWIENIHLAQYESDEEFFSTLYPRYLELIAKAERFLEETGAGEEVLVFISCGFDASLHEYPYMSRHGRKVPTSFYYRFAQDVGKFAHKYAKGRVVSVLEGGYSQRALSSGAFAHLVGLVDPPKSQMDEGWWDLDNLLKLEKAAKPKTRRSSAAPADELWVERTLDLVSVLDVGPAKIPSAKTNPVSVGEKMTLRDRKKPEPTSGGPSEPAKSTSSRASPKKPPSSTAKSRSPSSSPTEGPTASVGSGDAVGHGRKPHSSAEQNVEKKLPKVTLRVKPPSS